MKDQESLFEPEARFAYSNTNYTILGVLIEEVTGLPLDAVLRARILEPLGLEDTYLAGLEEDPEPFGAYTNLQGPTRPVDCDYTAIATDAWAAGALVGSVADLSRDAQCPVRRACHLDRIAWRDDPERPIRVRD